MAGLKAKFDAAQEDVKKLTERPDNDTLLELYALFKQATVGDVTGKRPGFMDFVGRAKFDAWAGKKGTTSEAAMQAYVDLVTRLRKGA